MSAFLLGTPFFRIFLAFVFGILMFEYVASHALVLVFLSAALVFFVAHYFTRKYETYKLRWLFGCGVFSFFIALGFQVSFWYAQRQVFLNLNKVGLFQVELTAPIVNRPKTYMLKVKTLAFAADSINFQPTQGNAILYLAKTKGAKNLAVGDKILVAASFSAPQAIDYPEEFDYAQYLRRKGFAAHAYVDSLHWRVLSKSTTFSIMQFASDCRERLLQIYKKHQIEGDEFAVLAALTLGYQDEIRDELYVSYSNSGALHILSVSGLHVGIVYLIFAFALSFLDNTAKTRLLKSLFIILLLWVYAIITGLSPSVMRAALMFSMIAFGSVFKYKSNIYNTIFFSALLLLCVNPNFIFDVSFLLSYSAVLSIVFFQPRFKKLLFFKNRVLNWSWDLFCVSVAAQIGTFPLGMYYFHKFSNHFLLTNFLAIPISTGIIYLAVLLFVFAAVPFVSSALAWCLKLLLFLQNQSIVFIDHLPYSTFHRWIGFGDVLLMYLAVLAFTLFVFRKRYAFLFLGFSSLLLIQVFHLYRHYESMQQEELIVYGDSKCSSVDLISGQNHRIITNNLARSKQIAQSYWIKQQLEPAIHTPANRSCFTTFAGKRICVLADDVFKYKRSGQKLKVDYLILANKSKVSMHDITSLFDVRTLVLDNTVSDWKLAQIKQACVEKGISYYSIKEKGAFRVQIDKKVH